ncbi:uncharacterized protein A1O9_00781 [Exophiala aquamarina CBS 119918]|uniref:ATP/GTP-binding protein n=1 Tax=Exophiala aquamarina CBS 119918 TaxID=1182545 RepID=A0A072PU18_9EURO|nr:uncharacterized protein A1O9_00781 [Exophiala aquamarina CBS 119918]KEF62808.1 hypothetical protein A1O9_00781 [Exophiala aquamarina CBS 119918]
MAAPEQQPSKPVIPDVLVPLLQRTEADPRPIVVMTCGIAGAGKSTLAKAIAASPHNFTRLSIDNILFSRHGLYGTDYPPSLLATYQDEADSIFHSETKSQLLEKINLVLDRAFYAKADRDEYRSLAEQAGARVVLVFLEASRDVLWRRIQQRKAAGRDADSALEIPEELLDSYLAGFERPVGEGEVVLQVA